MSAPGPASKAPARDLRRSERVHTFFGGRIVFHDGAYSYECIVRDMSKGGARVDIPAARLIPRRFYFLTSKEEAAYDSELVWRTRLMAGVKFCGSIQLQRSGDRRVPSSDQPT